MTKATAHSRQSSKTLDLVQCALFVALMAVGAFIHIMIPLGPSGVTISLQVFFAVAAGLLLGPKKGFIAVCVYLLLGLLGVPIYAHGGGISYVMKPTYGFLIGFAFAALVAGAVVKAFHKATLPIMIFAAILGEMAYYACGLIYYFWMYNMILPDGGITVASLFSIWFFSTVIPDAVICIGSAIVCSQIRPHLKNLGQF